MVIFISWSMVAVKTFCSKSRSSVCRSHQSAGFTVCERSMSVISLAWTTVLVWLETLFQLHGFRFHEYLAKICTHHMKYASTPTAFFRGFNTTGRNKSVKSNFNVLRRQSLREQKTLLRVFTFQLTSIFQQCSDGAGKHWIGQFGTFT